ncbi:type VII secretion integral membrane protein EccD [Streptomyces sp. NPDC051664]|uniref:type VII secretion integral membrane protein EccD n=1 Tax=Streptomyces sp. NPDC051664 TaxID=3365668 RepID=UPI0037AC4A2E
MSESSATGLSTLCRVTVRGPDQVLDLAVPGDIPVADLLPAIVSHVGEDLTEAGLDHGGWVLQRIGGPPLDPEGTPESLHLNDGEVLILRPMVEALPPVRFDNLVDGVSSVVHDLPHAWSPAASRWSLRAVLLAVLTAALILLALSGSERPSRAALSAGAALLTLAGAGAAGRVLDDMPGAVLLGLITGPFAALAAALVVDGTPGAGTSGARCIAASAAWGIAAALALTVVAAHPVAFASSIVVALAGVIGGVLMVFVEGTLDQAAAAVTLPTVIFGAFVPILSFSLSGFRLPPLPTNAGELQEGIDPYPNEEITARSAATDRWMTGLYVAIGVISACCLAGLALQPRTPQLLCGCLLALVLVLHARQLGNAWQRLALTLPGALGAVLLAVCAAQQHKAEDQLGMAAGLLGAAVAVAVVSWTVPGHRLLPYWGRAGDLLQSAAAIALLPSALWVLNVYADLRGIKG